VAKLDRARPGGGVNPPPGGPAPDKKALPVGNAWRNIICGVIIVYLVAAIYDATQRKAFQWNIYLQYLFDQHVSQAALITIELTVLSMVLAAILALLLAVMRLSNNPILKWIAWGYIWIFRGTPVYVQLTLWGLLSVIYPALQLGLPFLHPFVTFDTNGVLNFYALAVIGLGLNEAAYLAEIVRAGILSVDRGQEEASIALGMTWTATMWRIVIPQSMRVIIPPTGNEFISMLKTTSLVTAIPFTGDLFAVAQAIAARTFDPVPLLLVASTWYLAISSILSVGQYFLEKRFARGIGSARPDKPVSLLVAPDGLVDIPAAEDGQ
jgi:polar amino acid transport system permease protein